MRFEGLFKLVKNCRQKRAFTGEARRPKNMEVEVKLKLPTREAHQSVAELLAPFHKVTHFQENVFFDGSNQELSSKRAVLRFRFYNDDVKCVVSLKAKASIVDGISRVEETEEEVDPSLARAIIAEPPKMKNMDCDLLKKVQEDFACKSFICLGGFRNIRNVYSWEGQTLELDETQYVFGTTYEVECETNEPETVRQLLADFLKSHNIPFSFSTASKFATFRSGSIPP